MLNLYKSPIISIPCISSKITTINNPNIIHRSLNIINPDSNNIFLMIKNFEGDKAFNLLKLEFKNSVEIRK